MLPRYSESGLGTSINHRLSTFSENETEDMILQKILAITDQSGRFLSSPTKQSITYITTEG